MASSFAIWAKDGIALLRESYIKDSLSPTEAGTITPRSDDGAVYGSRGTRTAGAGHDIQRQRVAL